MKAVTFRDFGGPEVLKLAEVDRPQPGADDVLVRIHAAGICYHDVLSRGGKIQGGRPGGILGHEIAGEIASVGGGVARERVGERVVIYQRLFCGTCRHCLSGRQDLCRNSRVLGEQGGGGYAEFACVPARNVIRIPVGLDMTAAALAVCPIGTSVRAALGVARLEPGQTVLITGAGGGVGSAALQIARAFGLRAVGVASAGKKDFVESLGAVHVPSGPDLAARVRAAAADGVDGVYDLVGGEVLDEAATLLTDPTKLVTAGAPAPQVEKLGGSRVARARTAAVLDAVAQLVVNGDLDPHVTQTFPLDRAGEALRTVEDGHARGKIVIEVGP